MIHAPFPWFGGKSRCASEVWAGLGPVDNYVEPFAGSLAVLLSRPDERWMDAAETVNDMDRYLSNFWRSLSQAPDEVAHWADWPVNECDLNSAAFVARKHRAGAHRQDGIGPGLL